MLDFWQTSYTNKYIYFCYTENQWLESELLESIFMVFSIGPSDFWEVNH